MLNGGDSAKLSGWVRAQVVLVAMHAIAIVDVIQWKAIEAKPYSGMWVGFSFHRAIVKAER